MFGLKNLVMLAATALLLSVGTTVQAVGPNVNGSYVTPLKQGTLKFVPVKRVVQWGYQGNATVEGRKFPATLSYGNSGIYLTWMRRTDYVQLGQASLNIQPDGTYAGTIEFLNKAGTVTDSGVVQATIVNK